MTRMYSAYLEADLQQCADLGDARRGAATHPPAVHVPKPAGVAYAYPQVEPASHLRLRTRASE